MSLSPYNPHGNDEDPTLVRSRDGRYFVCWFSNRNGNDNLYLMHSQDGVQWSQPIPVTSTSDRDFYPSLYQDQNGRFHLAWFRVSRVPPFPRHIWYTHSDDGLHWDPRHEVQVTHGWVSDWAPSMVADSTGRLLMYFASQRRGDASKNIYLSQSMDQGITWTDPIKAIGVNDRVAHDDYPYAVPTRDGNFLMAWTRYSKRFPLGLFDPSMDIYVSRSADGLHWQPPLNASRNETQGIIDVFPFLYPHLDGTWALGWISSSTDPRGDVVSVPVSDVEHADPQMRLLVRRVNEADYSARAVPTDTVGTYLVVWVTERGNAKTLLSQLVQE